MSDYPRLIKIADDHYEFTITDEESKALAVDGNYEPDSHDGVVYKLKGGWVFEYMNYTSSPNCGPLGKGEHLGWDTPEEAYLAAITPGNYDMEEYGLEEKE